MREKEDSHRLIYYNKLHNQLTTLVAGSQLTASITTLAVVSTAARVPVTSIALADTACSSTPIATLTVHTT